MLDSATALIRQTASLLRLRPFDVGTAEGRARERYRRIALSAGAGALAKAVSMLSILITVPLTLNYLGPERYGFWMTLSSFMVVFSFADLGVGNGLMTAVAEAHGRDDADSIRRYVASGYFMLVLMAVAIVGLFLLTTGWIAWGDVFNLRTPEARQEAEPAVLAFVICFALAIPITLVQRIQMGLQMGFVANLWQCAASLLGLGAAIAVVRLEGGLPLLVAALLGVPLLAGAVNTVVFFAMSGRPYGPSAGAVTRRATRRIGGTGLAFLLLQLIFGLAFASDNFLITRILGPAAVADYAVPEKMFSLLATVVALAMSPLWPAYGEAIARGDVKWVRQTLRRSIFIAGSVVGACAAVLALAAEPILSLWMGRPVTPSLLLLVALAVWKVQESIGQGIAMYANAARMLKAQLILAGLLVVVVLPLKYELIGFVGIAGTVLATNVTYLACVLVPWLFLLRTRLREEPIRSHI